MKIKWLGQGGYILNDGKTEVCIDPYLSDCVKRIAGRERMRKRFVEPQDLQSDIVICTHNHLDHLDIDAIPLMNLDKITFYAPSDCKSKLLELGVKHYMSFNEGDTFEAGEFKVAAVFAKHTVPAIGVLVEHKGKRLYFSGDTLYDKKLEQIKCDYMFVCINGKLGNMNVDEANKLKNKINPKVAVPNHYDMFASNSEDPAKFIDGFVMEFNREYEVEECLI